MTFYSFLVPSPTVFYYFRYSVLRFLQNYELIDIGLTRALSSFIIASKTKSVDTCGGKQKDILYIEAPNFGQRFHGLDIDVRRGADPTQQYGQRRSYNASTRLLPPGGPFPVRPPSIPSSSETFATLPLQCTSTPNKLIPFPNIDFPPRFHYK